MVVDWCIDHPEYTAKIKVIPKKDYPILMPCEFWDIHIQAKRFKLSEITGVNAVLNKDNVNILQNIHNTVSMKENSWYNIKYENT